MKYCFVLFILIFLSACEYFNPNHSLEVELKKRIGSHLILPLEESKLDKKLAICSYINGECPSCIDKLFKWREWGKLIDEKVDFIFYFYSIDTVKYNYISKELEPFCCKIIYDSDDLFIKRNDLPKDNAVFQTFLIDKNGCVILVGNPLYNSKLSQLYMQEINKLLKNNDMQIPNQ